MGARGLVGWREAVRSVFRTQLWWSAKVLPVIGTALLAAILADAEPLDGCIRLAAMLVSAGGIASMSHLINDWADIEADARAGKPNHAGRLSTPSRVGIVAAAAVVGAAPWFVVRPGAPAVALIAALFVLPIVYSAPPVRLKGRGAAGVVADAADAHVVPTLLAFTVMAGAGAPSPAWKLGVASSVLWSSGVGVRAILHHQVLDLANDQVARVTTFVAAHGPDRARHLGRPAFAIEITGLAGFAAAIAITSPWVLLPFACYLGVWLMDQRWTARAIEPVPGPGNDWMPLVEFYQVWPAVIFSGALVLLDPAWWPVPLGIAMLFGGVVAKQSRDLWRMIRSAGHDLAVALVRASWWVRRRPLAWLRLSVYWPIHDRLAAVGHFRRRQARRIRRRWRNRPRGARST